MNKQIVTRSFLTSTHTHSERCTIYTVCCTARTISVYRVQTITYVHVHVQVHYTLYIPMTILLVSASKVFAISNYRTIEMYWNK